MPPVDEAALIDRAEASRPAVGDLMFSLKKRAVGQSALALIVCGILAFSFEPAARSQELSPSATAAVKSVTAALGKAQPYPSGIAPSAIVQDVVRDALDGLNATDRVAVLKALQQQVVVVGKVTVDGRVFVKTDIARQNAIETLLARANADLAAERGEDQAAIGEAAAHIVDGLSRGRLPLENALLGLEPPGGEARALEAAARQTRDPAVLQRVVQAQQALALREAIAGQLRANPSLSAAEITDMTAAAARRLGVPQTSPILTAARALVREDILSGALGTASMTPQTLSGFAATPDEGLDLALQAAVLRDRASQELSAQREVNSGFNARAQEALFMAEIQADPPKTAAELRDRWQKFVAELNPETAARMSSLAERFEDEMELLAAEASAAAALADRQGLEGAAKEAKIREALAGLAARSPLRAIALRSVEVSLVNAGLLAGVSATWSANAIVTATVDGGTSVSLLTPLASSGGGPSAEEGAPPARYDPCDGVIAAYCGS